MGNASAKEGDNGHMATSPELAPHNGDGSSSSAGGAAARPPPLSPPDAVMLERPPPVPYLFAPQLGDECPNLQRAFEVWWRRTFVRPYVLHQPDSDAGDALPSDGRSSS